MTSHRRRRGGLSARPFTRWGDLLTQFVLIGLAALCYFGVRGLTQSAFDAAQDNAEDLVRIEAAVGLDVEDAIQDSVLGHDWLVTLSNWVYIYGHWPVIALTLGWLFARAPDRFRLLRNAMFISGALGLVIFALYPVAPPRLGALDVVDTVTERSSSYRAFQPPGLINRYAAMPSLHFGWNLLVGVILWNTTRTRLIRAFAVVMPILMAFAVVATANHYVVDVIAGGALALLGLAVARRLPDDLAAPFRRRVV